ncbi:M15 family metallopeptidase [Utexia brackfieldae]|uniref:M15 family metallopeptidase n=1 Tax=Utexia brackfieldae TaxID=3074108 RepID=UPI00370D2C2A
MITNYACAAPSHIPLNELIGQFNEKQHPNYIRLDSTVLPVNKPGMYLQKEVVAKLIQAYQAFKSEHPDIPFLIVSATRNYDYQSSIWQRKWQTLYPKLKDSSKTANEILRYSSMPGTSRHHWGTDVDITSVESSYFHQNPKGKILYAWLLENMPKYGFCQSFNIGRQGGYQPEEWHWSYQPIAKQYIAEYKQYMDKQPELVMDKLNFIGHEKIPLKTLISQYVFVVNQDCY